MCNLTNIHYEVLEEYNPEIHLVKLKPSQLKCIALLKKGDKFQLKIDMIQRKKFQFIGV